MLLEKSLGTFRVLRIIPRKTFHTTAIVTIDLNMPSDIKQ